MQIDMRRGMRNRVVYHWARLYSSQLVQGDQFEDLAPCVSVFLLGYDELPSGRFHSTFHVREDHDNGLLTDQLELHLVQLRRLPSWDSPQAQQERPLVAWGRFFMAKDDKEREDVAMTDPDLAKAKQLLEELSADPVARRLAEDRAEGLLMYRYEMNLARREGRDEGRAEGVEEGKRKLLLSQAGVRFGELPHELTARIAAASAEELTRWGVLLMTAESLDAWCEAMQGINQPPP